MMCTKTNGPIFMLTYFNKVLFGGFDGDIFLSRHCQGINIYYFNICLKSVDA